MSELPIVEELTRFDPATDFIPPDHIRRTAATLIRELVEALEQARIFVADLPIVGDETLKKVDAALAKAKQSI